MKPKLADGSRWEGETIIDNDDYRVAITEPKWKQVSKVLSITPVDDPTECSACWVADALAALRKVDPVWDATVRLREWWEELGPGRQDLLPGDISDRMVELCRSVKESSDV